MISRELLQQPIFQTKRLGHINRKLAKAFVIYFVEIVQQLRSADGWMQIAKLPQRRDMDAHEVGVFRRTREKVPIDNILENGSFNYKTKVAFRAQFSKEIVCNCNIIYSMDRVV